MAKATEKSSASKFVDATPHLYDITTIHTDPNIASIRANLMRGGSDGAVSDDIVRALEVLGIANAVAARFCSTPQHHAHATKAARHAGMILGAARQWVDRDAAAGVGASTPASGEGDDGYRAFLLRCLDWVHKYGTVRDGASADTSTCLCPRTAYLQLILRHTPMEDWAAAVAEPDSSPLAFAWAWARTSPGIGRQTADVVVLVTMGRHVHRLMADVPVRAEEMRRSAATKNRTKLLTEGVWAALRGAVKDCLTEAATRLGDSLSDFKGYKRVSASDDAE
jgi:hypothetical protein